MRKLLPEFVDPDYDPAERFAAVDVLLREEPEEEEEDEDEDDEEADDDSNSDGYSE